MAARGPPPSLPMPTYPNGGGSGGSSDAYRGGGRNRSAGSSRSSSREHSVEGRGDNRRGLEVRNSGDVRASYNNQYQGQVYEANRRNTSAQNWSYGREQQGDSNSQEFYWRDDRLGVHGRVQGVWEDENGSLGSSEPASGYSLTIGVDSQGRRSSISQPRQENSHGANRRLSNGYDSTARQENGHAAGSQRPGSARGGYDRSGGYRRSSSQSGSHRDRTASLELGRGATPSRVLAGNDSGIPKEVEAFGYGRELETFGSQSRLKSRSTKSTGVLNPPAEEAKRQWPKDDATNGGEVAGSTFKGFKEGDLRHSFLSNGDGWRSRGSSSPDGGKTSISEGSQARTRVGSTLREGYKVDAHRTDGRTDKSRIVPDGYRGERVYIPPTEDGVLSIPSPSSTTWSSGYPNNHSSEREIDLPNELVSPSRSSIFKKPLVGRNSHDRVKRRDLSDQLPVFSPSSEASNSDTKLESSIGRLSQGSSSRVSLASPMSELAAKDLGLDGIEDWNTVKQQLPDKTPESASAGMHRTRSTDWYEICLKEEEEEEMLARTRKIEEESNLGNPTLTRNGVRNFPGTRSTDPKRGESAVFSLSVLPVGNYRETKTNVEKGRAQERFVRGDAADLAQPNSSSGQRNGDVGGRQTLFTPWNALEPLPASRNIPSSAPRPKTGHQFPENGPVESRESVVKQENLRLSIAGGRQEARGRRSAAIDPAEAANWRTERRPSRDPSREIVRPDASRESIPGPSGRATAIHTKEIVPASVVVPEALLNRGNGSIRPATFYRALHEAVVGDDEALPHIVGTCPDMCPSKERSQRERLRDLAVFERVSGDMRKTSKDLAVKKFCRTVVASELESTDVRPLPVLLRTQQYLLGLLDDPEFSFDIIHNFLFDRTRAIRQELGMQRIFDHQSITIHEEIVRFHIVSEHELRDLNMKRSKQFDTHLNLQQLSKSLHSLLNLYISLGGNGETHFVNEAEFHAYYVLLHLGNHGRFHADPLSLWFPNVSSHVLEGAPMQFARKALRSYRSNNFIGFFRTVKEATYLQACLLELNFDSVRAAALEMLNIAEYKLHPYPLSELAKQLILEENEVDELCMYYGLLTGTDNSSQKLCLLSKQGQFSIPVKGDLPQHSCPLIDEKRAPTLYQEVKAFKVV